VEKQSATITLSNLVYSYLLKSSFIHEVNIYIDKNRAIQYEEVPLFTCMSVYMKGFSFFGCPFSSSKEVYYMICKVLYLKYFLNQKDSQVLPHCMMEHINNCFHDLSVHTAFLSCSKAKATLCIIQCLSLHMEIVRTEYLENITASLRIVDNVCYFGLTLNFL